MERDVYSKTSSEKIFTEITDGNEPRVKLLSVFSTTCILIAIFGFGYGWAATKDRQIKTDEEKGTFIFSVSAATGNGLKEGIIPFLSIGALLGFLVVYNRVERRPLKWILSLTVLIILSLLISLIYINPTAGQGTSDPTINSEHIGLALSDFTVTLIFNLTIYYYLYKQYADSVGRKALFISLALTNIIFFIIPFIIMFVKEPAAIGGTEAQELASLFSISEIIQILFFLTTILLLGFYYGVRQT